MFTASLINNPFSDPGVYVEFKYRPSALLFDLGDIHHLSPRNLFKISHIFISHTHMDHFIGFDHLLRVCLGRDLHISLFGPPGFLRQVENKLNAYTWNLIENYTNDFTLHVTELHPDRKLMRRYHCRTAFKPEIDNEATAFNSVIVEEKYFSVKAAFLDHKIPCLAYRFEEKNHLNIKKTVLDEMGLPVGAWLLALKDHILKGDPDETPVRVWWKDGVSERQEGGERMIPLGELKERVVKIAPGKIMTYVTDVIYNEENSHKIVELANDSDILFIEAAFLHEDAGKAALKFHLTAAQAGMLARKAGAKRIVPFHFSPKYKGSGNLLVDEAMAAFNSHIFLI